MSKFACGDIIKFHDDVPNMLDTRAKSLYSEYKNKVFYVVEAFSGDHTIKISPIKEKMEEGTLFDLEMRTNSDDGAWINERYFELCEAPKVCGENFLNGKIIIYTKGGWSKYKKYWSENDEITNALNSMGYGINREYNGSYTYIGVKPGSDLLTTRNSYGGFSDAVFCVSEREDIDKIMKDIINISVKNNEIKDNHEKEDRSVDKMANEVLNNNGVSVSSNPIMGNFNLNMGSMFGEIGQINGDAIALTFTGEIAVKKSDGSYVRYDSNTNTMINMAQFIMPDAKQFLMALPTNKLNPGDIIRKEGKIYQIVSAGNTFTCIDFESGLQVQLLKEKSIFGIGFYTKIISLLGNGSLFGGSEGISKVMLLSSVFGGNNQGGLMNTLGLISLLGGKENSILGGLFGESNEIPKENTTIINNTSSNLDQDGLYTLLKQNTELLSGLKQSIDTVNQQRQQEFNITCSADVSANKAVEDLNSNNNKDNMKNI